MVESKLNRVFFNRTASEMWISRSDAKSMMRTCNAPNGHDNVLFCYIVCFMYKHPRNSCSTRRRNTNWPVKQKIVLFVSFSMFSVCWSIYGCLYNTHSTLLTSSIEWIRKWNNFVNDDGKCDAIGYLPSSQRQPIDECAHENRATSKSPIKFVS